VKGRGEEAEGKGKRGDRSGEGDDSHLQPYNEVMKRTYG